MTDKRNTKYIPARILRKTWHVPFLVSGSNLMVVVAFLRQCVQGIMWCRKLNQGKPGATLDLLLGHKEWCSGFTPGGPGGPSGGARNRTRVGHMQSTLPAELSLRSLTLNYLSTAPQML